MTMHLIEQLEEAVGMPKTGEMSPLLAWAILNRLLQAVPSNNVEYTSEVVLNG